MSKAIEYAHHPMNLSWVKSFFGSRVQVFWVIVLLMLQNVVVYQNHYFHDVGFPWDFPQGYYAFTAFWTTLASQGFFPAWVPFHSMGMPFDLILQTGSHYPPLWIFPLLRIEYSLHAAVVFQCLHVLFGALGMFAFLQVSIPNSRYRLFYAFFGAFVFQFFGGFYSNAQHVDIIRAYAMVPWLFYFFWLSESGKPKVSPRHFFIPGIILFFMTGAYPGNIISGLVVVGLFCLLQMIFFWQQGSSFKDIFRLAGFIFLMAGLGLAASFFHLAPAWLFKDYLVRSAEAGNFGGMAKLGIQHLPALFLVNDVISGDTSMSMTSTYITLPALILLSFLPMREIKQQWVNAGILAFTVLMVAGSDSFFWFVLAKLFSPMRLSRFPSSDYRIFIAIMLIYFACLGLKTILEGDVTRKSLVARCMLIFFWFFQGIYVSYPVLRSAPVYQATVICLLTLACLAFFVIYKEKYFWTIAFLIMASLLLTTVDAIRVLPQMGLTLIRYSTWQEPAISTIYDLVGVPLKDNNHLLAYEILAMMPERRPERIIVPEPRNSFTYYQGFVTGKYILNTFKAPNLLQIAVTVLDTPFYEKYMLDKWMPVFIEQPKSFVSDTNFSVPFDAFRTATREASDANLSTVRQTHYGINEIEYNLSLSKSLIMIENEIYFPGWTATLISDQGITQEIQAFSVNGVFRAWQLPAGNYKMTARFEMPNQKLYSGISIVALLLWVFAVSGYARSRKLQAYLNGDTHHPSMLS